LLSEDSLCTTAFDQANYSSDAETPEMRWPYHCCKPGLRSLIGGPDRAGGKDIALNQLIGSRYIIVHINERIVVETLIAVQRLHKRAFVDVVAVELVPPSLPGECVVWEMFAGSARWTMAMAANGWGYLTPFEINSTKRRDLTNMFILERVLRVGECGAAQILR
jgi:hypothetical protein